MNYTEAREYLNNVSASGIILGLDSIRALMEELDNPQDDLRIVHIAGTNGRAPSFPTQRTSSWMRDTEWAATAPLPSSAIWNAFRLTANGWLNRNFRNLCRR